MGTKLFSRISLAATVVLISAGLASAQMAGHMKGKEMKCAVCGCSSGKVFTVTDWSTNKRHKFGCLSCAVHMMKKKFTWSRLVAPSEDGDTVTLTRTASRWSSDREDAVVVPLGKGGKCRAFLLFSTREAYQRWAKKRGDGAPEAVPLTKLPELVMEPMMAGKMMKGGMMGQPARKSAPGSFADVPPDHWAADAVASATAAGLIKGFPDKTFRGDEPVTRYQLAEVLARLREMIERAAHGKTAPAAAEPASKPRAQHHLKKEAGSSGPQGASLRERLLAAGLTEDQVDAVLKALAQTQPVAAKQGGQSQGQKPAHSKPVKEKPAERGESKPPAAASQRRASAGLWGQSGLLVTPTADVLAHRYVSASFGTVDDAHATAVGGTLAGGTELTATVTSGDLPTKVLISAKQQVYHSSDGKTRAAVGVVDITDEIDTTAYAVVTRQLRNLLGLGGPALLSVGIGGGDLLDGLFVNLLHPLGSRLSAMAEWAEVGRDDQLNGGLEYRSSRGIVGKVGVVDGKFAVGVSVQKGF